MHTRLFSAFLIFAAVVQAQTFEAASIKPAPDFATLTPPQRRAHCVTKIDAARVQMNCSPLRFLILRAYGLDDYQLSGPDWMATQRIDLLAKLPDGATENQVPAMLQALLADRFKLVVRRESREEPVYALVVGKDGPKLKEAPTGDLASVRPFPNGADGRILLTIADVGSDGWRTYSKLGETMVFDATRITLPQLAKVLMNQVDRPVVDRTGLTGAYEVSMPVHGGPNGVRGARGRGPGIDIPPTDRASVPSGADIFKSVEKLGLVLERTRVPIEHITVESVARTPSEN
jgi:uncharacterized protein (TIGR03435 family)